MYNKIVHLTFLLLLISSPSFASDPNFTRSSDGRSIFINLVYIEGCATGYAVASIIETNNYGLKPNKDYALTMAKSVCVDDTSIVSIYNAMRNGGDINSISDAKKFAEKRVEEVFNSLFERFQSVIKKNK